MSWDNCPRENVLLNERPWMKCPLEIVHSVKMSFLNIFLKGNTSDIEVTVILLQISVFYHQHLQYPNNLIVIQQRWHKTSAWNYFKEEKRFRYYQGCQIFRFLRKFSAFRNFQSNALKKHFVTRKTSFNKFSVTIMQWLSKSGLSIDYETSRRRFWITSCKRQNLLLTATE